jgi:LPLT family lysophospholipid transporter-like MFS transporter
LLGTVVGARIADSSIELALLAVVGTFLLSAVTALRLPRLTAQISLANGATQVAAPMRALWADRRTRLILWALSLFWACAATLRVVLVAWAPEVLSTKTASQIAELTLFLALGIIAGSAVVPRLIPLERIRRTRFAGYALGGFFLVLAGVDQLWSARAVLLLIGVAGGIFVVPLNAAIQQAGHRSVGSGGAVAVQNFFQNSAMLLSIGLYAAAAASGLGPVPAIAMLGIAVTLFTATMSARL